MLGHNQISSLILLISIALTGCGGGSDSSGSGNADTGNTDPVEQPTTNATPTANAGVAQSVDQNTTVTLDGSASADTDGDTLSYTWTFSSQPEGATTTLMNSDTVSASFIPAIAGDYILTLTVNDGTIDSVEDSVTITVIEVSITPPPTPENTTPIANAGIDQTVTVGSEVFLTGAASTDADGDSLSFNWVLETKPNSSIAILDGQTSSTPSFTADIFGEYGLSLIVNDGTINSVEDIVTVTASNTNVDITNMEFSNRAGNCENYVGSYFSNVTDIKRSLDFSGDIVITSNGSLCTISVNKIPNHDFNDNTASFATNVSAQSDNDVSIPVNPVIAGSVTELALGTTTVVTLNGVDVDILPAACYGVGNEPLGQEKIGCGGDQIDNPWRYDPMSSLNDFGTDAHNAHSQPDGAYHYHGNPMAMFDQDCETSGIASPVIGFAADGFPVYGMCFEDPDTGSVRQAKSSFAFKNNGGTRQAVSGYTTPVGGTGLIASNNYDGQFRGDYEYNASVGDLDECNGMTINGQYGYYITNEFPWVLACYKGTVDDSFKNTGPSLSNKMHSHSAQAEHSH